MQQTNLSAYLIIQIGSRWTDVLRLQPGQVVHIGRSSECEVAVRDERVSRKHAHIHPSEEGWLITDFGSRNGTQVDGQSIAGPRLLVEGNVISVGGCNMTFTQSLSAGFASQKRQLERGAWLDSPTGLDHQATQELNSSGGPQDPSAVSSPIIVERLASSKWSSSSIVDPRLAERAMRATDAASEKWNFFYRVVFALVSCESPDAAAQVALDQLLEQLQLSSGGIVTIEAAEASPALGLATTATPARATSARASKPGTSSVGVQPVMAVLAARQANGGTYHRVSDFLVETVISERRAVLARNVQDDAQLSMARESGRRETVSIICAPLRERNGDQERVSGLLHVYSTANERPLTHSDLELAVGVADNLAIALSRQRAGERLAEDLKQTRRKLDQLEEQFELTSEMVGHSRAIALVEQAIERAAPTAATVLIRGESGVGKELVARAVHRQSKRRQGPFVCLNCAALAPTLLESELFGHEKGAFTGATDRKIGKFEAADGGTLLLDEIGEMIPELQAKFLRVLEGEPFERLGGNKPIRTDVRVIAATNRNLEEAIAAKQFRADLYFRLRVIEIEIPPLRERLQDVPELVEHFLKLLKQHAGRKIVGVEPQALELMCRYHWPGNIRELRNVIERAVVLGADTTINVDDLSLSPLAAPATAKPLQPSAAEPERGGGGSGAAQVFEPLPLADVERAHIQAMLEHVRGNKSKASQLLGIERSTLDRKLKKYEEGDAVPAQ